MTTGTSSVCWNSISAGGGLTGRKQTMRDTSQHLLYLSPLPVWTEVNIFNLPCFPVIITDIFGL